MFRLVEPGGTPAESYRATPPPAADVEAIATDISNTRINEPCLDLSLGVGSASNIARVDLVIDVDSSSDAEDGTKQSDMIIFIKEGYLAVGTISNTIWHFMLYDTNSDSDTFVRRPTRWIRRAGYTWCDRRIDEGKILEGNFEQSGGFFVSRINALEFDVKDKNGISSHVNLSTNSCSCFAFQLLKIPCSHAIVAAIKEKISVESLVFEVYNLEKLQSAYAEAVYPICDAAGDIELNVEGSVDMAPETR
ncbi:hypothetical protein F2Q69_00061196 [Brassica cretica]|uniref:SWIM-type domain-containing protein n=1 Tax=Brassica cretica TaxID=69181 RepID=A0A8S9RHD0_BRACR|nr:hypothetical protein F2Q69_00061196 [Brassica cretica]